MGQDQNQAEMARYISKLLRDNFGKGPESIFVHIDPDIITITLRHFMSPTEKLLIDQEQKKVFHLTRDTIMTTLLPEIKAYIKIITGIEVREFYYDWGLHNGSGIIIGIATDWETLFKKGTPSYAEKEALHDEITKISQRVEKAPDQIFSFFLNPRTLLVFRVGILVTIEKELIRQGYEEVLKITKRDLEKRYFHNNPTLESLLHGAITDLFVDWNFSTNNSIIVISLTNLLIP